jgi:outer membrane biosynthesis protein TonB
MNVSYQAQRELERKNQIKALIITIIFNGLLFLLIWQLKIWNENPNAPVSLEPEGSKGEISFEQEPPSPKLEKKKEIIQSETEVIQQNTVPPITSNVESPVTVKATVVPPPKEVVPEEPVVDLNLTLGKRAAKSSTSGTGAGTGLGKGGAGGGSGSGNGNGNGGSGSGSGDKPIAQNWTFPTSVISSIDNGNETGEITFFIRVNEKGLVTEIRIEKTNVKLSLAEKYKKAIKGAKFQPKDEGKREGASGLKTIRIVPTN